jgi:hypothetical protein
LLLWDAGRGFRNRGELWKPALKLKARRKAGDRPEGEPRVRRRSSEASTL